MGNPESGQAVWFTAPREIELRAEEAPDPARGEVRVRAIASAISHGSEMLLYRGELPGDLELDLPTLAGSFAYPIKYGYALVGRIVDTGPEVAGLSSGDVVFVLHPHQSVFTIPASLATRLTTEIEPVLGVFSANLETAVNILHDAQPRLGDSVVVFGLGTVGLLVIQLLRIAGAGDVIAVDPVPQRRELARELGATVALAPDDDLVEQIRQRTAGRGADLAIEVSGSPAALQSAIDALGIEGTVVVASW